MASPLQFGGAAWSRFEELSLAAGRKRIVKQDVMRAVETQQSADKELKSHPISTMRQVIAERLCQSKRSTPHFYLSLEVRLDALIALREDLNALSAVKITLNDCMLKAAAMALAANRAVNCSWQETSIAEYASIDVAVAVAIEGGLITPVLCDADKSRWPQSRPR